MTEPEPAKSGDAVMRADELAGAWRELELRLRDEYTHVFPAGEEVIAIGGGPKRLVKRSIFRVVRPLIRRYDRLIADAAGFGSLTARSLHESQVLLAEVAAQTRAIATTLRALETTVREHDVRLGRAATELELLASRRAAPPPSDAGTSTPSGRDEGGDQLGAGACTELPEAYYWRFESELRGTTESVTAKLQAYRGVADGLRERLGDGHTWLDLGCGEGQFLELLRGWGWRVRGMDISSQAVERCRSKDIDAVVGSLPEYLLEPGDEAPAAISLIQVIEHLPTAAWLPTIRLAERVLAPGGQLVIETIDPRNPRALQAFYADITHTWAAHPDTLRVMAGFAGFASTEVRGLNPDESGTAQDFVLIATKADGPDR